MLRENVYFTEPQSKPGSSSLVWTTFHVVKDRVTNMEVGTAMCIACGNVLSMKSGISSLKKHQVHHCTGSLGGEGEPGTGVFRPVPGALREVFIDKMADTCALSMGSINLLTSPAVVELIQVAVDISARCKGRVDVQELMPHPGAVVTRIDTRAQSKREILVPRVKKAIAEGRCQASTDMWTDDDQKRHFIAITVTLADEEGGSSDTFDLVVAKFPTSMKSTGINIRNAMFRSMNEIGFTAEEFEAIEWVTDRGANIKKALEDLSREDCAAHLINTVVRSAFTIPYYEVRGLAMAVASEATTALLETAEEAVKVVRSADPGLALPPRLDLKKLKQNLQLPNRTFHGNYSSMLKSLATHKKNVLTVLRASGGGHIDLADRLTQDLETPLFTDLIDFFGPLDKKCHVTGTDLASMMKHLDIDQERDSPEVMRMKSAVKHLRTMMDVLVLIKEAKEVVTYLKSSGLASSLSKKVLQECETRWNSIHTMLQSVEDVYDEIVVVLAQQPGQQRRMEKIDREMLAWLVNFLRAFKEETKTLEGNDHPTLPFVVLAASALQDDCELALDDSTHLEVVKTRCLKFLNSKFRPSLKAKVATFLWPDYKDLEMIPEAERVEVQARVRTLIGEDDVDGALDVRVPTDDSLALAPPSKKLRLDKYAKYKKQPLETPQDEISRYMAMSVSVAPDQLLKWWGMMDRPDGLPKLAKLAKRELCKLATAAPSERVWSKTGFILNNRRNRLAPKHLESIVFLGSYLRNLKKIKK
ncbi:Transposable element Hobo transposase [Frankliniella fusca]|uniref:Transposable element Hobo transposase n=1 Tax=Frankliniella fusca TaxID=407009 RepID=A0AAE1LA92_9NEOP|nr:Transposable element Hobo transposase [Frankliniella fusca]